MNSQDHGATNASTLIKRSEFDRIRTSKIGLLPQHKELDDEVVAEIAASYHVHGQAQPIIVRRVRKPGWGEKFNLVLVAGAHRLAAAVLVGEKYINCMYFEGDEEEARLVEIGENLFRKRLTVLQRAELYAEWVDLVLTRAGFFSGQVVPKSGPGRPLGRISQAAIQLPVYGDSFEARRKQIQRYVRIARLSPEAKKAALEAGLADNQDALLEIVRVGSDAAAQVKKVQTLARRRALPAGDNSEATAANSSTNPATPVVASPPVQPRGDDEHEASSSDESVDSDTKRDSRPADTDFVSLETAWNQHCRKLWIYAPADVRQRFLEKLRSAPCKSHSDIVGFVRSVFQGREEVYAVVLKGLAETRCLRWNWVRKALKELGYKKRKSGTTGAMLRYVNVNRDWKDQRPVVPESELKAARMTAKEERESENDMMLKWPGRRNDEYYDSI